MQKFSILHGCTLKITHTKYQTNELSEFLLKLLYSGSALPEVFLGKNVLEICSKFAWEHPWWRVISIKLQCNFIEITLLHRYSPVNFLHIFRTPFNKNTFLEGCFCLFKWPFSNFFMQMFCRKIRTYCHSRNR